MAIAPLQVQLDALRSEGWGNPDKQRLKQVSAMFADIVGSRSHRSYRAARGEHLTMKAIAALTHLALCRGDLPAARQQASRVIEFLNAGGALDDTEEPLRIRLMVYQTLKKTTGPIDSTATRRAHSRP